VAADEAEQSPRRVDEIREAVQQLQSRPDVFDAALLQCGVLSWNEGGGAQLERGGGAVAAANWRRTRPRGAVRSTGRYLTHAKNNNDYSETNSSRLAVPTYTTLSNRILKRNITHNTYIAPQAATAAALYVTDRASVQPIGRGNGTLTCNQTTIRSPDLPFNGLHPRNPWITTYLPTSKGWKAELDWLVDR